jgi:uncharacterized membrane protein YczE
VNFSWNMTRRIGQLAVGLYLYGLGIALMVRAGIGVAPWDVLTLGIEKQTGLEFGVITVITSVFVLLLWIPIRQKPGIGTLMNVLLVGPAAQLSLGFIPVIEGLLFQVLVFIAGLLILAVATGLYIGARFGPGPRDGLMTGIHNRWGVKIWIARTSIEVVVLSIGWVLGGNVGIGTLAFALLIGPLVNITIPRLRVPVVTRPEPVDITEPPTSPVGIQPS